MDSKPPMATEMALIVGAFAGFARQMHLWLANRTRVTWKSLGARLVVSVFSAWVFHNLALKLSPDNDWIATALGGWLGTEGITYILSRFSPLGEPSERKTP